MNRIPLLDLCSGIGGFSLGLERTGGFETVAFCEIEEFPQRVLKKHWPGVPIYEDLRQLSASTLWADGIFPRAICAGYPCQPFSHAGKRRGEDDDRHLWPEVFRLVQEIRPDVCFFENVAGHITMGLDQVLSDLEGEGYACRATVLPACSVGAFHRRDRVWIGAERIISNATSKRCRETRTDSQQSTERTTGSGNVSDPNDMYVQSVIRCHTDQKNRGKQGERQIGPQGPGNGWDRPSEPGLGRGFNGVPSWLDGTWEQGIPRVTTRKDMRADRLKALGNAVVPQVVEAIGNAWLASKNSKPGTKPGLQRAAI